LERRTPFAAQLSGTLPARVVVVERFASSR
jgi:hypothetical protein